MSEQQTIWLWGQEGPHPYHDQSCQCPRHCPNCFCDLADGGVLGPKARYCSNYCKNRAKRERALDRQFSS